MFAVDKNIVHGQIQGFPQFDRIEQRAAVARGAAGNIWGAVNGGVPA
jgi:hypothetical protein